MPVDRNARNQVVDAAISLLKSQINDYQMIEILRELWSRSSDRAIEMFALDGVKLWLYDDKENRTFTSERQASIMRVIAYALSDIDAQPDEAPRSLRERSCSFVATLIVATMFFVFVFGLLAVAAFTSVFVFLIVAAVYVGLLVYRPASPAARCWPFESQSQWESNKHLLEAVRDRL